MNDSKPTKCTLGQLVAAMSFLWFASATFFFQALKQVDMYYMITKILACPLTLPLSPRSEHFLLGSHARRHRRSSSAPPGSLGACQVSARRLSIGHPIRLCQFPPPPIPRPFFHQIFFCSAPTVGHFLAATCRPEMPFDVQSWVIAFSIRNVFPANEVKVKNIFELSTAAVAKDEDCLHGLLCTGMLQNGWITGLLDYCLSGKVCWTQALSCSRSSLMTMK